MLSDFYFPWAALFGGMLLGLSAFLLMLFNAKVAGISGIVAGVIKPKRGGSVWRVLFLLGMLASVFLLHPLGFSLPDIGEANIAVVIIAGLLVGFGTRLGNGCTSGHGIVGIGRFNKRSLLATMVFMGSAMLVVFMRGQVGWL